MIKILCLNSSQTIRYATDLMCCFDVERMVIVYAWVFDVCAFRTHSIDTTFLSVNKLLIVTDEHAILLWNSIEAFTFWTSYISLVTTELIRNPISSAWSTVKVVLTGIECHKQAIRKGCLFGFANSFIMILFVLDTVGRLYVYLNDDYTKFIWQLMKSSP